MQETSKASIFYLQNLLDQPPFLPLIPKKNCLTSFLTSSRLRSLLLMTISISLPHRPHQLTQQSLVDALWGSSNLYLRIFFASCWEGRLQSHVNWIQFKLLWCMSVLMFCCPLWHRSSFLWISLVASFSSVLFSASFFLLFLSFFFYLKKT